MFHSYCQDCRLVAKVWRLVLECCRSFVWRGGWWEIKFWFFFFSSKQQTSRFLVLEKSHTTRAHTHKERTQSDDQTTPQCFVRRVKLA